MLKSTINCLTVSAKANIYNATGSAINVLSVRHLRVRKPIYLGTAKSKLFRVPPRRKDPPEERAESLRLMRNYGMYMLSVKADFKAELERKEALPANVLPPEADAAGLKELHAINEELNSKTAAEREVRLVAEREKRSQLIEREIEEAKSAAAEKLELIENMVRYEKNQSKTFILPDQIDEAIEEALDNIKDYNFAIDLKGNIYEGRRTKDTPPPTNEAAVGKAEKQQPLLKGATQ